MISKAGCGAVVLVAPVQEEAFILPCNITSKASYRCRNYFAIPGGSVSYLAEEKGSVIKTHYR